MNADCNMYKQQSNKRKEVRKMNILEWLLQTTSKGATYLQAITLTTILIPIVVILVKESKEFFMTT